MLCEHPECNGVHNKRVPYAQWCPAVKRAHAEAQSRYKHSAKGIVTDVRYEATRRGNR